MLFASYGFRSLQCAVYYLPSSKIKASVLVLLQI